MKEIFNQHLNDRIRDYPIYINIGPGKDEDPIGQITCGYSLIDPGWIVIVFDTRSSPKIDGEWTKYIEGNEISVTKWGIKTADENANFRVGERLKTYLLHSFESGGFSSLPVSHDCILTVEENNGTWGWSSHADTSGEAYLAKFGSKTRKMAPVKAIAYWISILHEMAKGQYENDPWGFLLNSYIFETLDGFGQAITVPLLKFVKNWADKPEFIGDRPSRKILETPMQTPVIHALQIVPKLGTGSDKELYFLKDILKKSIQVNEDRRLWGLIPYWTADALNKLFNEYPKPTINGRTNRLMNIGDYNEF